MLRFFFYSLLITLASTAKLPPFLKPCLKNDHKCALEVANNALPGLFSGYKPFRMPSVDPFKFTKLDLSQGQSLKLFLLNGEVSKLTTLVIKDAKVDDDNKLWRFKSNVSAVVDADYEVGGKILILPVQGKGKCHIELDNIDVDFSMKIDTIVKDNVEYLKCNGDDLQMKIRHLKMQFDGLFNGDKVLGEQINLFINENWQDIEKEFHQGIVDLILSIIRPSYTKIFNNIPKKELVL